MGDFKAPNTEREIVGGSEFRAATLRVREGGMQELLDVMGPLGFFNVSNVRVSLLEDGELYLQFLANLKKEERHVALPFDVLLSVKDLRQPEVAGPFDLPEADLTITAEDAAVIGMTGDQT